MYPYDDDAYYYEDKTEIDAWQSLVHVCRRWRSLVFGSPRQLNLRLFCTLDTPAVDKLDIWPALPLIVKGYMSLTPGMDNIIAALGQSNRVRAAILSNLTGRQLEEILAAMQVPFPELTGLWLSSDGEAPHVIPDSFLDGSASRLRIFELVGIPFPGLPKLLLSANHLVTLRLSYVPHAGYISPGAMAVLLCASSNLEVLSLGFESPQSRPDLESRSLPPPKRSTLPALHYFYFQGVTEYLEELVTRIDIPQLNRMYIKFFNQIDFDTPRLSQFINRTPVLRTLDEAHVLFYDSFASAEFKYRESPPRIDDTSLRISISCRKPDWQLSSIEQVCNFSLPPASTVEGLYIERQYSQLVWNNDAIESTLWLQLLLPFTAVKNIYLSKEFEPGVAAALQELAGDRMTGVLPSLENICVEGLESWGPFQENIRQFVAARRLSGHPVPISVKNSLSKKRKKKRRKKKVDLSCMRSTLASIGSEADIVVCAQRRHCGRYRRAFFLGLHELGIAA